MTPEKLASYAAAWVKQITGRWVVAPDGDPNNPAIHDPRLSDVAAVAAAIAKAMNCE